MLSEQYKDKQSSIWFSDTINPAAVWVLNSGRVPILCHSESTGFFYVKRMVVTFFSVYLTPSQYIADSLEAEMRNST